MPVEAVAVPLLPVVLPVLAVAALVEWALQDKTTQPQELQILVGVEVEVALMQVLASLAALAS